MNHYHRVLLCLVLSLNTLACKTKDPKPPNPDFPPIAERYLGQRPPGRTPELFAPDLVSTTDFVEAGGHFTPDMREFYFTRYGGQYTQPTLFVSRYGPEGWSEPTELSSDIDAYIDRFHPGWSAMKSQEPYKDLSVHGFSVSDQGTYFVDEYTPAGDGPLRYARLIDGKREDPKPVEEVINTGKWVAHPYIAPDESFLLWDVEREGDYGADIYLSFRQSDGTWGKALNLGPEINTGLYDQQPRVTPDGRYLFFWKGDEKLREDGSKFLVGSLYWVDAQVIHDLRPKS